MKIAIVGFLHYKEDKRVMRTVKALSKLGEVTYLYWSEKKEDIYCSNGIIYVPFFHRVQKDHPLHEWNSRKKHESEIINFLREHEFDIIYFHHFATTRTLAPYAALSKKKTTIITDFHEYIPEEYLYGIKAIPRSLKSIIGNYLYKRLLKRSDGAVFVSWHMHKMALKIKADLNSLWIPNYGSFIVKPYQKVKRRKEIVFVGKIQRKMIKETKILAKLIERGVTFTVIGSAPYSNVNYIKNINFLPLMPYEKMIDYISKSAFTIISYDTLDKHGKPWINYIYSMPNKFFDSICAGTPVIVDKNFEEMKSFVEEDNTGLIIDRNNVEETSKLILNTWGDSSKYESLIDNISGKQERYCWDEKKEEQFLSFVLSTYKEAKRK